jgi:hypothetical protein
MNDEENIETTFKKSPERSFQLVKTEIEVEEIEKVLETGETLDSKSLLSTKDDL